jgi:tetratricopeptide (TPR) repeat protein
VSAAEVAARETPRDPQAAVLLAQTLRAQGNVDRATRELEKRMADTPESAALHIEMGWLSLHRQQPAAARASFEQALKRAPDAIEARHGLVAADVAEKKFDAARARVAAWRQATPADVRLGILAARIEFSAGDLSASERLLREVIAADASQLDAYELLGRAYVGRGKVSEAIAQYETLASRSPDAAVAAKTMVGMLYEVQGDKAKARAAYERALAEDAKAGVAANNLAWMVAQAGNLDEALRLATIARDTLRRRPEAEDTVGWVYLQKGLATQAIASFERARERAPTNAVYHYHLGLAYIKLGDQARARAALTRALELKADFNGAADARAQLAALAEKTVATR